MSESIAEDVMRARRAGRWRASALCCACRRRRARRQQERVFEARGLAAYSVAEKARGQESVRKIASVRGKAGGVAA